MPKEVHYLLFSRKEIAECLRDYASTHAASGADRYESVQDIVFIETSDGNVGAHIKLRRRNNPEPAERYFVTSDILSALLSFCRRHDIPVAQRAHKAIEVFGDQIALMMIVDFPAEAPTVVGGELRYTGSDAAGARSRVRGG
jgi:hypothetical protein